MRTDLLCSLDALIITTRDPESRKLAEEAVSAYNGGAFRAAILSIWVAVCADIISKLRELSTGGDKNAKSKLDNLSKWISLENFKELQHFEGELIQIALKEFEMILPHEAKDLMRLREDRHLCAHPALVSDENFFSPTAELARTHIVHAITHLLSHPPVQGKSLLARLDRDLLGGSFPSEKEDIEKAIKITYLSHAKTSAIRSLIRALTKKLTSEDSGTYRGKEKTVAEALASIGRIFPQIYESEVPAIYEKLGKELGGTEILRTAYYIGADSRIWDWLSTSGQIRILAKIDSAPLKDLVVNGVASARHTLPVGFRLLQRLEKEDATLLERWLQKAPCMAFVPKALEIYGKASSFSSAEIYGETILLPHAEYFSAENIERLAEVIKTNKHQQIISSNKTAAILSQVFDRCSGIIEGSLSHWALIASYIVELDMHTDYDYPNFLKKLALAGVPIPQILEDDHQEKDDADIPF